MNIKEFRNQYPQYDHVSDQKLANTLYEKFYSSSDKNEFFKRFLGGVKPESFSAGLKIPEEGLTFQKPVQTTNQKVSDLGHNILPVTGGVIGSSIGATTAATGILAPASPIAIAAGGAGGAAIGEQFADVLDEWLGVVKPRDFKESAITAGENIKAGAEMEAMGQGMAAAVRPFAKRIPEAYRATKDALNKVGSGSLEESSRLKEAIPGYKETYGMATQSKDALALERAATESGKFPTMKQDMETLLADNKQAISNRTKNIVNGDVDDFTAAVQKQKNVADTQRATLADVDQQQAGKDLLNKVAEEKKPVQAIMNKLEEQIPDYPMDALNFESKAKELISQKKVSASSRDAAKEALSKFKDITEQLGVSSHSMFGFKRTLDDMYDMAKTDTAKREILQLRDALLEDFNVLSRNARTGKIKTFEGKVYQPDQLAAQLDDNALRIAQEESKGTPDVDTMRRELVSKGLPTGESPGWDAETAVTNSYKQYIGKDVPMVGGDQKYIEKLVNESQNIRELLGKLSPGQDVATLMKTYNEYASQNFFNRFKSQSMTKATNKLLNPENVTKIFNSPTAINELIAAVGKQEAKETMRQFYQSDLSKVIGGGEKSIYRWYTKNAKNLQKLGLRDEFYNIVRTQHGYQTAEKLLNVDNANQIFDELLKGNKNTQKLMIGKIRKQLAGNNNALLGLKKAFFEYVDDTTTGLLSGGGENFSKFQKKINSLEGVIDSLLTKQEKAALMQVQDAVNRTQSFTARTTTGGSPTAPLKHMAETSRVIDGKKQNEVLNKVINTVMGAGVGGVTWKVTGSPATALVATGAAKDAFRAIRTAATKHGDDAVRAVFNRAMFDPNYAKAIVSMTRGSSKKFAELTAYMAGKIGFNQIGHSSSNMQPTAQAQ